VVTLAELFINRLDEPGIHATMVAEVKARLQAVEGLSPPGAHPAGPFHMLGTSGTVTTIAGIHLKLDRYERSKVDGTWLMRADALAVASQIASMDRSARAAQPCIGLERSELVIPGLAIFQAIFELWPAPRLRVADRGLREGMLLALMGPKDEPRRRRRQRRGGRHRRFRRRGPKPNGQGT
jgi:exopolyphosphatase/guanosine-5'-triphosphate,3'-diphosphate pyrophosphatase